jgi:hypothetical protein
MTQPRTVRCCKKVDRPFDPVAAVLCGEPSALLQRATTSAAARAASLAANLHVEVMGLEVGVNVRLSVRRVRRIETDDGQSSTISVELTWEAIRSTGLFPSMLAELTARPRSAGDTQLEMVGAYWTPMGPLGAAIDAALGHRIAEASVQHFLEDVAAQLQSELKDA